MASQISGRWSTVCAILIGSALVLLTVAVSLGATVFLDRLILEAISKLNNPTADTFFRWVTWLGSFYLLAPVAALIMLGSVLCRNFRGALLFGAVFFGSALTTMFCKMAIGRLRPDLFARVLETLLNDYAFPSGHATHVTAFACGLIWLAPWYGLRRWTVAVMSLIVVCLVIFSRLYLQVHWPSDVLGGVLVSLFWGSMALALTEPWVHNDKRQS